MRHELWVTAAISYGIGAWIYGVFYVISGSAVDSHTNVWDVVLRSAYWPVSILLGLS